MTDSGHTLRENNDKIVKLIAQLKKQRKEMNFLIEKQELEKGRIQTEIEKLSFKLSLLTKSLTQRLLARTNYDKTIEDIEGNYGFLVEESGKLLSTINKEVDDLEQIMDKKTGTSVSSNQSIEKENNALNVSKEDTLIEEDPFDQPVRHSLVSEGGTDEADDEEDEEEEINEDTKSDNFDAKVSDDMTETIRRLSNKSNASADKVSLNKPQTSLEEMLEERRRSSQSQRRQSKNSSRSVTLSNMSEKPEKVVDNEVQSYREAYGKQHSHQPPVWNSKSGKN